MDWTFEIKKNNFLSPSQQSLFLSQPPPPPILQSDNFRVENKINPSILLIIIILAIIFFISGLLHLLVRFLMRPSNRDPEVSENATALQGQLQQLFNLHDAGVDQSFIDTLPVFVYKTIIGVKNPFDCAVCLCEFEAEDKLRLLPKCSHAFHMECIDTWLLSHSTCPLCRGSLLPDFPPDNNTSPIVLVLESGSESSRELVPDREPVLGTNNREDNNEISQKSCEIPEKEESTPVATVNPEEVVVPVKLGKFRNVDVSAGGGAGDSSSNSNVDARRCFSMGSFEYVLDENSSLQVAIRSPVKKHTSRKPSLPLTPGRRPAMSECDCNSSREGFKDFDAVKGSEVHGDSSFRIGREVGRNKTESFSVSKIWLRSKKEKPTIVDSSRRASSFRLPLHWTSADDLKQKHNNSSGRTITDIDVARWENGGSGLGLDEEVGSSVCQDSQANPPSFGRRTLLWLGGRQNKVGHLSSSPTNV